MAIKRTNLMLYCPMCNIEKNSCDFYETINPHDGYMLTSQGNVARMGYTRLCKDDIYKCYLEYLKKGTMQSAVYFTCALTDTPFIKEVWERYIDLRKEKIKSGKITPNQLKTYNDFAKYREQLKAMKKATDDWIDFSATNVDYTEIMGLKKPDIALEAEKDKFILDWGEQETLDDYRLLEYYYDELTEGVQFKNKAQELLYRDLCQARLKKRKIESNESSDDIVKVQNQILVLMNKLKIDNFEEEKSQSDIDKIIEKQIWEVENKEPCEVVDKEYYKDFCDINKNWGKQVIRAVKNLITGSREYPDINTFDVKDSK